MIYTRPFMFYPCQQITSPLVYTEDLSIAQQIAHLFGLVKQVTDMQDDYVTNGTFREFLEWLETEQDAQSDGLKEYSDNANIRLRDELIKLINEVTAGQLQWNVQHGEYSPSKTAQRDMFADVTFRSYTVGEFDGWDVTVKTLSECGLNVAGWAVANTWLVEDFPLTQSYLWVDLPNKTDLFTYEDVKNMGLAPEAEMTDPPLTTEQLANTLTNAAGHLYIRKDN